MDVANGYTEKFVDAVKYVRSALPDTTIIAGNVVTAEMVEELILAGADIIKIGIGGGCFKTGTRVLMGNGTYKNIEDIKENEFVINKDGIPVKVLSKTNKGVKDVIKIRSNASEYTYVTPDHSFFIGDLSSCSVTTIASSGIVKLLDKESKTQPKQSKYKWKEINECDETTSMLLMPNNIQWKLDDSFKIDLEKNLKSGTYDDTCITTNNKIKFNRFMESGYDLGYIFGTHLGDGHARIMNNPTNGTECGATCWYFNITEDDIANKLSKCIENVLGIKPSISKKEDKSIIIVSLYNKCISTTLMEFGKKTEKHLPSKYYCSNDDYIEGIFDGLIDSDGNIEKCKSDTIYCFTNTSKQLIELFSWCCFNLKKSFGITKRPGGPGGLKNIRDDAQFSDSYRVKTHTLNRFTEDYVYSRLLEKTEVVGQEQVWDIEVDCPTHSFIADNMIVHNSVCITRKQAGIGYPQLSAIIECADAAHGLGGHIISDGGCTVPGDVAKAFGAGAYFVMLGGMLAGHFESGGENIMGINEQGESVVTHKEFYGMSSDVAMKKYSGGVAKYRSSEGKAVQIKYKGKIEETVLDTLGGLRSSCTYVGAVKLKELSKRTTFVKVTQQLNNVYN